MRTVALELSICFSFRTKKNSIDLLMQSPMQLQANEQRPDLDLEKNNREKIQRLGDTLTVLTGRISELESALASIDSARSTRTPVEPLSYDKVFNKDAMLSTGLSEAELTLLRERLESGEMEKLY